MNTLSQVHAEIQRLSELRADLWHRQSAGFDADAAAELKRLNEQLDHLWDEHRAIRATLRFGPRDQIVARARVEERLERAA
jgi:hypothetical protein